MTMMAWFMVAVAGLFETGFAVPVRQGRRAGVVGRNLSGVTPP